LPVHYKHPALRGIVLFCTQNAEDIEKRLKKRYIYRQLFLKQQFWEKDPGHRIWNVIKGGRVRA
jgi:hypothetical protein